MKRGLPVVAKAWLLAGTLDILAAFIYYFIKTGNNPFTTILQYIASGIYGQSAFTGGTEMLIAGLLLHYFVALCFTLLLFFIYPYFPGLFKRNLLVTAIVYGLVVWTIMNLVVVPLSQIGRKPLALVNSVINMLILIVCIALPLCIVAKKYYKQQFMSTELEQQKLGVIKD